MRGECQGKPALRHAKVTFGTQGDREALRSDGRSPTVRFAVFTARPLDLRYAQRLLAITRELEGKRPRKVHRAPFGRFNEGYCTMIHLACTTSPQRLIYRRCLSALVCRARRRTSLSIALSGSDFILRESNTTQSDWCNARRMFFEIMPMLQDLGAFISQAIPSMRASGVLSCSISLL